MYRARWELALRDILSWEVCDICERRVPTRLCRVDSRVLRVCDECLITLQGLLSCGSVGGATTARRPRELSVNEELLSSLKESHSKEERKYTRRRAYRSRES
ncbi:hypothetical protein [Acidilobus sp.]|uniref:hypothetical protein n=1 Tax=Acidilobus sp. TaxID=1872109 RepID=UPI003D095172